MEEMIYEVENVGADVAADALDEVVKNASKFPTNTVVGIGLGLGIGGLIYGASKGVKWVKNKVAKKSTSESTTEVDQPTEE